MSPFTLRFWLNQALQALVGGKGRKHDPRRTRRFVPRLGELETRLTPSVTVTVNTTNDTNAVSPASSANDSTGHVSLRSAVEYVNHQASSFASPNIIDVPAGTYVLSIDNGTSNNSGNGDGPDDLVIGNATNLGTNIVGTGASPGSVIIEPSAAQATAGSDVIETPLGSGVTFNIVSVALTLQNLEVTGCTNSAVFVGDQTGTATTSHHGSLTVNNCLITGNSSPVYAGGAVVVYGGDLTVTNSTFSNNVSAGDMGQGGAIVMQLEGGAGSLGSFGSLSVSGSTFTSNSAEGTASGVVSGDGSDFNLAAGGAIYLVDAVNQTGNSYSVTTSTFNSNKATGGGTYGGAIGVAGNGNSSNPSTNATVTVSDCRFVGNTDATAADGANIGAVDGAQVNANDNWWLSNSGPGSSNATLVGFGGIVSTITATDWLDLQLSASPTSVEINHTSTATASFLKDSANNTIAAANLTALVGLPVTYGATGGSIAAVNTTVQSSGTAAATFTAGATRGAGSASATVDGVTAMANLTVVDDADLAITANTDSPHPQVGAGNNITYTITFKNNGPDTGFNATVTDPIPANTTFVSATLPSGWSRGDSVTAGGTGTLLFTKPSVTSGETDTFTVVVKVAASTANNTNISNTATAGTTDANTVDSTSSNNAMTATTNVVHMVVSPTSLANPTVGQAYTSATVSAVNGSGLYNWTVSAGALPPGLALSATTSTASTTITGTPTSGGPFSFTLTATDASNSTFQASQAYSVTVAAPTVTFTPAAGALPAGVVGSAYGPLFSGFVGVGGTAPYTFARGAGTVPPGLLLNSNGTITGSPTTAGNYSFTVIATDSSGGTGPFASAAQSYTMAVNQAPSVSTQPMPQTVTVGQTATFTAAASGFPAPTVQWQVSVSSGPFSNISGATSTTYSFTPALTDSGEQFRAVFTNSVTSTNSNAALLTVVAPVKVAGVQVNDGSAQRSEVRSIAVTFSGLVSFAGGNANAAAAFQLNHVQTGNNVALTAVVTTNGSGQTVVTLKFSGAETDPVSASNGGIPSLADGRYTLTITAASVTDANGAALDGDNNGTIGGNFVSPTDTQGGGAGQLQLYRLFGDATGDGTVDSQDLGQFRTTYNLNSTNGGFLAYLDADNSNSVDSQDLGQFRTRYNTKVFPTTPSAATPPPTVASVAVNDGSAQRSEVRSLSVTFSGPVSFSGGDANAAAAFQLQHLTDGNDVKLAAAVSADNQGRTVVTLTFAGAETDALSALNGVAASLADGRYQLTILSASVTATNGATLNGGSVNGNYVSPTDTQGSGSGGLHLFRLFGDVNGDGVVDAQDLGQFRTSYNVGTGSALYLAYLDADNSGFVDSQDLGQFRARFNASVFN